MKKLIWILGAVLALGMGFVGCAGDGGSDDSPDVLAGKIGETPAYILACAEKANAEDSEKNKVMLFYYRADGDYSSFNDFWLWGASDKGADYSVSWNDAGGGAKYVVVDSALLSGATGSDKDASKSDVNTAISEGTNFSLIIKKGTSWTDQGGNITVDLTKGKHFLITSKDASGGSDILSLDGNFAATIVSAITTASDKIKVELSVTLGLETVPSDNGFKLVDESGAECSITVTDGVNALYPNNRNRNNATSIILTLSGKVDTDKGYYVVREGFGPEKGVLVSMQGAVKESVAYEGDDLGLTFDKNNVNKATFKVWAPLASDVKLLLYSDVANVGNFADASVNAKAVGETTDEELEGTPAATQQMNKDSSTNVWSTTIDDVSSYKYYKYKIVNAGKTYYICDIYAKAGSADAIAAQIVDINSSASAIPSSTTDTGYGTKEKYFNPQTKSYDGAIIYEMHISDWSMAETSSYTTSDNVGKYLTIANGTKVINHLKDLGVTHVQILPVFEFAETNANTKYNWGYNPYHYNLPEGRYVSVDYTDGTQAVLELRTLIAKLHEAGIAVNMDVVYNHTSGIQTGSLYDSQVPGYFYRFESAEKYSNGSGCGNEIDSEAPMVKKYIIDSLKHWMLDYHFNGFRFDLMGCLSKETMKEIYDALYEIDPYVMVYGEPWAGGNCAVVDGANQAVGSNLYGAGAFDDDFRDAIKGAEFGGFKRGQVQDANSDSGILKGLIGKSGNNSRNTTEKPGMALHYVECHDNYTLFDKLAISRWQDYKEQDSEKTTTGDLFSTAKIGDDGLAIIKKEDTLAAAYVLLSQGTAFLNGGQEFLRTKRGNENSYNTSNSASTSTNGIDLTFKETYSDVYKVYKGLIALRKENCDAFGANASASATKVSAGVTKYTTGDFLVYFNATDSDVDITTTGYTKAVDVTSGTPTESATLPTKVGAKSFVILTK